MLPTQICFRPNTNIIFPGKKLKAFTSNSKSFCCYLILCQTDDRKSRNSPSHLWRLIINQERAQINVILINHFLNGTTNRLSEKKVRGMVNIVNLLGSRLTGEPSLSFRIIRIQFIYAGRPPSMWAVPFCGLRSQAKQEQERKPSTSTSNYEYRVTSCLKLLLPLLSCLEDCILSQ